jgi:hypothetical protein
MIARWSQDTVWARARSATAVPRPGAGPQPSVGEALPTGRTNRGGVEHGPVSGNETGRLSPPTGAVADLPSPRSQP